MACTCHTGETPGKGCYCCTNCCTEINIDQVDKMPNCPSCNNTSFNKS